MAQVHEIYVWLMVNEQGEYEVATDSDACGELFTENCTQGEAVRKVCLKLRVPSPEPMELTGDVPPEPIGTITLTAV